MQPETPTSKPRRRRHFGRWILLGILATFGWSGWKAYDFHLAKQEAQALGWGFINYGPVEKIREDWQTAFHKETWSDTKRTFEVVDASQLESNLALVQRLNPHDVTFWEEYPLKDLSLFQGLSRLAHLNLLDCTKLTNLDALKGMKRLKELTIANAPSLKNFDALKHLERLSQLRVIACPKLSNVDALRELKSLEYLDLHRCTNLQNIDGILGLTQLKTLDLYDSTSLPKEAIDALKAVLPNTEIQLPDGEIIPPRQK